MYVCMYVLLYGAETWTMYASDLEALEAFQNNCLRRILRSSWMDYTHAHRG